MLNAIYLIYTNVKYNQKQTVIRIETCIMSLQLKKEESRTIKQSLKKLKFFWKDDYR